MLCKIRTYSNIWVDISLGEYNCSQTQAGSTPGYITTVTIPSGVFKKIIINPSRLRGRRVKKRYRQDDVKAEVSRASNSD